ncbi:glycosyltransferase family 2 protein [Maioricimonas sp. JC845]|uniref:glycosyltransferase family 2 protein n=1 Tax=Maioricimonas sp. JC845 TaxID=3232138 RepID=UPI003457EDE8
MSPELSIVVPVFNEEGNVRPMYHAIREQMAGLDMDFELVFVDDGSSDNSLAILRELHSEYDEVRVISFSRNFGHQSAVSAGIEAASGKAVICMDADLQHPPSMIPQMVEQWRAGYQVVYTIREDSTNDIGLLKRWFSSGFYRFINWISETPVIPGAADFRLMDRSVVDVLVAMPERSRFLRGMVGWLGFNQIGIRYQAASRHSGQSKYSLRKMIQLAMNGIASFSAVPLRLSGYLGVLAASAWIPYGLWAVYLRLFTDQAVPGWTSLLVMVLFLGGVQLIALGILGEYVSRIYTEVKGRPLYIAQQRLGFDRVGPPHESSDNRQQTVTDVLRTAPK